VSARLPAGLQNKEQEEGSEEARAEMAGITKARTISNKKQLRK
jgi:hypothetical protein